MSQSNNENLYNKPVQEDSKNIIINIDKSLILAYLKILIEDDFQNRNQV